MNPYHRMSLAEKQAYSRQVIREPAVTCPTCDTQVVPADLLAHLEQRCAGPREPGPGAKWVTWREVMAMGVTGWTLTRWVQGGEVRHKGGRMDRVYLLRDIVLRLAHKRASRRR